MGNLKRRCAQEVAACTDGENGARDAEARQTCPVNYINLVGLLDGVNRFYDLYTGGSKRPVFFDIEATSPELLHLGRSFPPFPDEPEPLLTEKAEIPRYHDLDRMQSYISAKGDPDKAWKIFY